MQVYTWISTIQHFKIGHFREVAVKTGNIVIVFPKKLTNKYTKN